MEAFITGMNKLPQDLDFSRIFDLDQPEIPKTSWNKDLIRNLVLGPSFRGEIFEELLDVDVFHFFLGHEERVSVFERGVGPLIGLVGRENLVFFTVVF